MPTQKKFTVLFQSEALVHLQKNIDYYNLQQQGLGKRFGLAVRKAGKVLEKNPFFQLGYDNIRCLPVEKFSGKNIYLVYSVSNDKVKFLRIME